MKNNKKKKKKKKKNKSQFEINMDSTFNVFEVVIFVFISIIFGMIVGCVLTYQTSSLSSIRTDSHLNEIVSTYMNIKNYYYEELDKDKLTNAAIKGMINSLEDPYSVFLDDDSTDTFTESIDGRYIGVGVSTVFKDNNYIISSVIKDSSADKAGLKENDIILEVDDIDCSNITSSDLDELLKGKIDSDCKIKIKRDGKDITYYVKRESIEIQNVKSEIYDDIGYISIKVFSSNSYNQFSKELKELENKNIKSLIIDIRNNPGGHLIQTRKILELFLKKDVVLYQTEKENKASKVLSSTKESRNYPVVVLINSSTASAAEVLAISLKENYKDVVIIGETSYGKGTVQKSETLSTGTSIKYTVEKWLTPKGEDINGEGIIPDIEVQKTKEEDTQLNRALEEIKKES